MTNWRMGSYRDIFQYEAFRFFWLGFTFSAIGDAMTRIAFIWFVYQSTGSPQAVGWLLLCYTGPVVVGGFLAGWLLDRFDRRKVMLIDNTIRGTVMAIIPLLYFFHMLALWHIYLVAVIYGFLTMITLAGGPSLVPSMVSRQHLATANALETLSYTLSGVLGPPIAGLLIASFGAPSVLVIDALSYATLAFALTKVHITDERITQPKSMGTHSRLKDAISLFFNEKVLLSTTLMFLVFNVGEGFLSVWLPVLSDRTFHGGSALYGILLGAMAVGEVAGAFGAGSLILPLSLGTLICLAQVLSGVALGFLLFEQNIWLTLFGVTLLGFFSAPLTIWAQTLRMDIIPEQIRGRTFALLRTLMQSSGPLASAGAGVLLPMLGIPIMIGLSALFVGVPGVFGYGVKHLRHATPSFIAVEGEKQ